jgi:hypothetical protein
VALSGDSVLVRDSKQRFQHILAFTYSEWRAFLYGAQTGEFDLESLKKSATPDLLLRGTHQRRLGANEWYAAFTPRC